MRTNFAKTYLDVVERPFTEEFHLLRGEFSHTVRLYFMRVVVNEAFFRIFKEQKTTKIFSGTSDFLRIFDEKTEAKHKC